MRVLHFFKTYLPDSFAGIEHVIFEIAEGTARLGVTTDVLSLSGAPHQEPLDLGTHLVHKSRRTFQLYSTDISLSVFGDFRRLAARADIVHYHFPWPMMDIVHLLSGVRRPSVVTYHSDIVRQQWLLPAYRPVMNAFLGNVDRIVATSPNYAQSSPVLRRYAGKTTVIPIGIRDAAPPGQELLDAWRLRVGEGFFLFVGTLRYYKGLDFLIEAARRTGYPVVVVGEGRMGDTLKEAGVPNLFVLGPQPDADRDALLALCRAFVFPSHLRAEAFGISLLEAARASKPMISCELGTGTSLVNRDGETGIVIRPADPAALAEAMTTLHNDKALAERLGAAARLRYEQSFRAEAMCEAYAGLYRSLLPAGGA